MLKEQEKMTISSDEIGNAEEVVQPIIVNALQSDPQFDHIEPTRCIIALKMSGSFLIDRDAYGHFSTGLHHMITDRNLTDSVIREVGRVSLLLLDHMVFSTHHNTPQRMTINYKDMQMLKSAVEAKMKHCEANKDSKTFNNTSYINMKYLLLDIKLWLSGEIISFDEK